MVASSNPRRDILLCLVAVLSPAPLVAQQEPQATSRLPEVLSLARERNPRLLSVAAASDAAAYRTAEASTLPDLTIQLGIMNFGVPSLNTDMAMSMAPSVQLSQRVPFPGKLSMLGEIAEFTHEIAVASADETWWDVRNRASALFYGIYSLDRRIEVMRETLLLLQDFQQVAKAMYGSGTGRQADVLRADVEVARIDGDIRQMEAMRDGAAARLNAILDRPAETSVPSPELGALPLDVPDRTQLRAWARESRPILERARLGLDQARKRSELAGRQIWPDFSVGVAYGQRDRGQGTERMASAMIGFSLPIHAGSRQYALRDETAALERLSSAELQGREAEVDARIGELLAELTRARTLATLYRDEVIPQARATTESAFSSYRVGAVDFMTLVDAQMSVNRFEGELFALLADYGTAISALESTVGRPLPLTGPVLSETR